MTRTLSESVGQTRTDTVGLSVSRSVAHEFQSTHCSPTSSGLLGPLRVSFKFKAGFTHYWYRKKIRVRRAGGTLERTRLNDNPSGKDIVY